MRRLIMLSLFQGCTGLNINDQLTMISDHLTINNLQFKSDEKR